MPRRYWYTCVEKANGRSLGVSTVVLIQFADRQTEIKGLAFMIGRFSGKVLRGGLHIVPEAALEALASQNIPYSVKGTATYEQQMAALRGDAAAAVQ
jgi:hypothetical protein